MSIDVVRLECVRGASIVEAKDALVAFLEPLGLSLVAPGGDEAEDATRLRLFVDGPWLVVVDADRLQSDGRWARALSGALGVSAVVLHGFPDFDAVTVRRFERGLVVATLAIDEETPRDPAGFLDVELPFLADVAPQASRPALLEGISVGITGEEIAFAIAEAACLPRPLTPYDDPPEGATELTFSRPVVERREPYRRAKKPLRPSVALTAPAPDPRAYVERVPEVVQSDASVDELAAFASFLSGLEEETPRQVEARQVRVTTVEQELPPLPGKLEDAGALDGYFGRDWAVGRVQWYGGFADLEDDLFALATTLGDALVDVYGDDVLGVELTPDGRRAPVRVGGPLAAVSSRIGAEIWQKIRPHFANGACLRLSGTHFSLKHRPARPELATLGQVELAWSVPLPPNEPVTARLSTCLDAVVRRAARSPHVLEVVVVAQGRPGELSFPRMTGLTHGHGAWLESHVASPGWRVLVPTRAAERLPERRPDGFTFDELPSGLLVASKAPSPYAMTAEETNRLAAFLLRAVGTKAELANLAAGASNGRAPSR